ncbi:MAG: cytochrome P450 [Gammaproteobacteria bacterium]|jgi:cytochrome P450
MDDSQYAAMVRPSTYANPTLLETLMAEFRASDPLPFIQSDSHKPFYIATKHADIIEIARQPEIFKNTQQSVLQTKEIEAAQAEQGNPLRTLIHMDDPDHSKFRALTKAWFMPENLKRVEASVRSIADETVDRMLESGPELDFVTEVAVWYPLRVIMSILGVPAGDEALMLKLTQELFGADDPDMKREQAPDEDRMQTLIDFFNYFNALTASRRANPTDDVASVIANAQIDGAPIGELEAMSYYVIIATAGHDTTSSSTAGGMLALLEHPEELQKVINNPALMPLMVDEAIRWTSPVKHFMRYPERAYELRGKTIEAGSPVMLLYPSGNRDEEVFDRPQSFLADRRPNRHLAFGHGAHHCLGNLLAKMEIRFLYEAMFNRMKTFELIGEPRWVESTFVSGLKTLPVRITPK